MNDCNGINEPINFDESDEMIGQTPLIGMTPQQIVKN